MLARRLSSATLSFVAFATNLLHRFAQDWPMIAQQFHLPPEPGLISRIELDIANQHAGESTAILHLDHGCRIVYKPGSGAVTIAYNKFLQWVNDKIQAGLRSFRVIDQKEYSWLEFVLHQPCDTEEQVKHHYERAGMLLGITYFLGSTDYHYENVIASGDCPVLIDHETIIGPLLKSTSLLSTSRNALEVLL